MSSIRDVLDRHGAVSAAWLYGSVARGEDAPESDVDIALVVRSQAVADQVREALMPLEDAQQIRISLTALTARDLAALPDDDPWWVNVVREGRVLKGAAPDQARRRSRPLPHDGQGPRKAVDGGHAPARLLQGREFHESARSLITLAQSESYNPAVTLMVTAAIAYSDAITAKARGIVNQHDHQGAPRLLREVLGNRLPDKQEKFFRKLLGRKDEVNYGARSTTLEEAQRLLAELDDFAAWAEGHV